MERRNTYTASTANLYAPDTAWQAFAYGLEEHVTLALQSGLDGVEWWPPNPVLNRLKPSVVWFGWAKYAEHVCHPLISLPDLKPYGV